MKDRQTRTRYEYVDNMKLAACVLVVLGHFLMSMTESGLMRESAVYHWFVQTIYTFHVALFFVCSGFLYQKSDRVHSLSSWGSNVKNKLLNLGVPYFTFSTVTVLLKTLFENEVNIKSAGLITTLLFNPASPYWYLYVLFFFFLLVPCFRSGKQAAAVLAIAFALKLVSLYIYYNYLSVPYIVLAGSVNFLWFAAGMQLAFCREETIRKAAKYAALPLFAAALALSIYYYRVEYYSQALKAGLGILFVIFIILIAVSFQPKWLGKLSLRFSKYFMPVFLLHTIFSAGLRIILIKLGVTLLGIHLAAGAVGGFVLPVITYHICEKLSPLMFFFYPNKAIKTISRSKNARRKEQQPH